MARRTTAKKGATKASGRRWAWSFLERIPRAGGALSPRAWLSLTAAAVLVGGALLARHLTREAYALAVFQVDPRTGIEVEIPPGVPIAWKAELPLVADRLARGGSVSIFDDEHLERVRREFEEVTWVLRADRVERRFPDRLFVRLDARVPVALVQSQGRTDWVDLEGAFLPSPGNDTAAQKRFLALPRILLHTTPEEARDLDAPSASRGFGRPARHRGLRAGCAVAAELEALDLSARLPAWRLRWIDARGFEAIQERRRRGEGAGAAECEIRLTFDPVAAEGGQALEVEWGAPPSFPGYVAGEGQEFLRDSEQRLRLLEQMVSEHPEGGVVRVHLGLGDPDLLRR